MNLVRTLIVAALAGPGISSAQPADILAKIPPSYLARGDAPDSLAILPPAPAQGSSEQARDDAMARAAQTLRGTSRWRQAALDAELKFPAAAQAFACALGVEVSPTATPRLYALLGKTLIDVGLSTYPTKTRYQRTRPFVATRTSTCTPDDEAFLRTDGSYPSGHSAVGWGWALVLAEAAPVRVGQVLARGRAFGQSRVICNVHWQSDVDEGRVMAAATVARLHAEPQFRADVEAARGELAAARAAGRKPARDCAAEAEALAAAG
jgi:acid phosphatase (class A)